jgi:DNA-binding response OmpR family regulator
MLRKTRSTRKPGAMSSHANGRRHATARELSALRGELSPSPVVLVISTDALLRWALFEALVAAGFRVLTCHDERQTREILPKVDLEIALAVIDEESWVLTEAARDRLRQRWPDMPIVLLAHPGEGAEARAEDLQVGVVMKPFDLPHLIETVTCAVRAASQHARQAQQHA